MNVENQEISKHSTKSCKTFSGRDEYALEVGFATNDLICPRIWGQADSPNEFLRATRRFHRDVFID